FRRQIAGEQGLDLTRALRMFALIGREHLCPIVIELSSASANAITETVVDSVRHEKLRVFRPAVETLGEAYFFFAERIAVRRRCVLLMRRAIADDAVDDDKGRPAFRLVKRLHCISKGLTIVGVAHMQHVPAIAFESCLDILAEGEGGVAFDGYG